MKNASIAGVLAGMALLLDGRVFEFDLFWGICTCRAFSLGAMYASYDKANTSREVAETGVRDCCEFDKNSSGPFHVHTIKLKASKG